MLYIEFFTTTIDITLLSGWLIDAVQQILQHFSTTFYKICIVTIVHTSNFLQDYELLQINVTTENTITIVFSLMFLHVS